MSKLVFYSFLRFCTVSYDFLRLFFSMRVYIRCFKQWGKIPDRSRSLYRRPLRKLAHLFTPRRVARFMILREKQHVWTFVREEQHHENFLREEQNVQDIVFTKSYTFSLFPAKSSTFDLLSAKSSTFSLLVRTLRTTPYAISFTRIKIVFPYVFWPVESEYGGFFYKKVHHCVNNNCLQFFKKIKK